METFSRETPPLDPWFVTGFADAAGSFTFSRSSGSIAIYFALKVDSADEPVLLRIRAFFGGAGTIYPVRRRPSPTGAENLKRAIYYRVSKLADLERVVAHFRSYPLQGNKRVAYDIWSRIFELKKRTFRRPDLEQLEALVRELSAASPRARSGKGRPAT